MPHQTFQFPTNGRGLARRRESAVFWTLVQSMRTLPVRQGAFARYGLRMLVRDDLRHASSDLLVSNEWHEGELGVGNPQFYECRPSLAVSLARHMCFTFRMFSNIE